MNSVIQDLTPDAELDCTIADGVPAPLSQRTLRVAGASAGAAIGAALGVFAGPVGIVTGAVLGAALSMLSKMTAEHESLVVEERDKELDAAIGVSGGEMGAPSWAKELPTELSFETVTEVIIAERESLFVFDSLLPPVLFAANVQPLCA